MSGPSGLVAPRRFTQEELIRLLGRIPDPALRIAVAAAMADVVGTLLTDQPMARAARGEVLVQALRASARGG